MPSKSLRRAKLKRDIQDWLERTGLDSEAWWKNPVDYFSDSAVADEYRDWLLLACDGITASVLDNQPTGDERWDHRELHTQFLRIVEQSGATLERWTACCLLFGFQG